jgi:gas vesicle protein
MGYIRGFMHGAVVGTVIGLSVAPQTGDKTRAQLRVLSGAVREKATATGRALNKAAPMAAGAVQLVASARHRGDHASNGTAAKKGATNGTGAKKGASV